MAVILNSYDAFVEYKYDTYIVKRKYRFFSLGDATFLLK